MRMKRLKILVVTISIFVIMQICPQVFAKETTFSIGIPLIQTPEETLALWQPLADYLNSVTEPKHQFKIRVFNLQELETAVSGSNVDFLFVNPSVYVNYSYRFGLTSPLATLVNREQDFNLSEFSGVIFTRSDREDINQLDDLKGLVVAVPSKQSLAAYQMQASELVKRGIDPKSDITLLETGLPLTNTLNAVMTGQADAGFMRAGVLEAWQQQGIIEPNSYRIVEPRQFGGFPWVTSTRLYPEWPFSALAHTDPEVVRQVTAALLNLPFNSPTSEALGIAGFTIPGDYRGIDRLLRELQIEPFDYRPPVTFKEVWAEWQFLGWVFILSLAGLMIIAVIVLKRNNAALALSHLNNAMITQQLQENEALLNHAQQVAHIGSWEYDLNTEEYNCTQQMRLMFSFSPQQKLTLEDFIRPVVQEDQAAVLSAWNRAHQHGRDYDIDYRVKIGQEVRWVHEKLHVIRDSQGRMIRLLGTIQDVTEKVEYEQHIESLAFKDTLTQIPNRAWLHESLDTLLDKRIIVEHSAFLILLNIDRFKTINNARGSRFGDSLLKAVGHRLQSCQIGDATIKVARMAGDEFAILIVAQQFAGMSLNDLEIFLSDHCEQMFSSPFIIEDEPVVVTVSTGVTRFPEKGIDLTSDQIFQRANMALAHSRKEGGGHLSFYESPMSDAADYRFKLERDLKRAVEHKELRLFMQPQFDVNGNKVAAELLLRWEHAELGMISPVEFIPIAEASNLIVELDSWVMTQACELIRDAGKKGINLHLAINISPRHFCKETFVPWIRAVLNDQMVDPKRFILEVTEGVFLHNIDAVSEKMNTLRQLGLQFSIDDFGTGYSSLAYLKRLPVNEIKIDRSFVQDAPDDADDAALIDAILAVADKMQLRVVAEGVETFEQADFLKERSESIIYQGYLFGRPAPVDDWLERWEERSFSSNTSAIVEFDLPENQ